MPKEADSIFRSLMEAAPDGILVVDEGGIIQIANAQCSRLFGYGAEELIGQPIEILLPVLRSDRRAALAVGDCAIIDDAGERVYWGPGREIVRDPDKAAYLTWVGFLRAVNAAGTFERPRFGRVDTLWRANYVPNGKLLRTSAVAAVGGWREGTLEDWDINFRLARRFALRYVDQVLFEYRWHDGNTIKNAAFVRPAMQRTQELIRRQMRNPLLWIRIGVHRNPLRRIRAWLGARRPGRVA